MKVANSQDSARYSFVSVRHSYPSHQIVTRRRCDQSGCFSRPNYTESSFEYKTISSALFPTHAFAITAVCTLQPVVFRPMFDWCDDHYSLGPYYITSPIIFHHYYWRHRVCLAERSTVERMVYYTWFIYFLLSCSISATVLNRSVWNLVSYRLIYLYIYYKNRTQSTINKPIKQLTI